MPLLSALMLLGLQHHSCPIWELLDLPGASQWSFPSLSNSGLLVDLCCKEWSPWCWMGLCNPKGGWVRKTVGMGSAPCLRRGRRMPAKGEMHWVTPGQLAPTWWSSLLAISCFAQALISCSAFLQCSAQPGLALILLLAPNQHQKCIFVLGVSEQSTVSCPDSDW